MKKTTIYIALTTLCLNLSAFAQSNRAVELAAKGVQIGQQVPDITISDLHNYKDKYGKGAITAKISDFKGKLLILDFWATWCSPCIAMIPKMDSLKRQFGSAIQILPITYQDEKEVLPFMTRMNKLHPQIIGFKSLDPTVLSDKSLHQLFPHTGLPHYVWIGTDGIVKAITGHEEVTASNIANTLNGDKSSMSMKIDDQPAKYEGNKPFLINGNGGDGDNILYHSILTGYTPGLLGGSSAYPTHGIDDVTGKRVVVRNAYLPWFYRVAFGDGEFIEQSRLKIEVKDLSKLVWAKELGLSYEEWSKRGNVFCYELSVPPSLGGKAFEIMRMDLSRFFAQYKVGFEKETKKCLVLVRTSKANKFYASAGKEVLRFDMTSCTIQNGDMMILFRHLQRVFQNSGMPIINETGYEGKVNLAINANMANIGEINLEMKKYDLEFIEANRSVDVLVIRDSGLPAVF